MKPQSLDMAAVHLEICGKQRYMPGLGVRGHERFRTTEELPGKYKTIKDVLK